MVVFLVFKCSISIDILSKWPNPHTGFLVSEVSVCICFSGIIISSTPFRYQNQTGFDDQLYGHSSYHGREDQRKLLELPIPVRM